MLATALALIAAPAFAIKDLGVELHGEAFLNDRGTVAGNLRPTDGGSPAFLYSAAGLFRLGGIRQVHGLNAHNALAVTTTEGPGVWEGGKVRSVPPEERTAGLVPGGTPIAVDDAGRLFLLGQGVEGVYAVWTWPRTRDLYGAPFPTAVSGDGWIAGERSRGRFLEPDPGPTAYLFEKSKRPFDSDPGQPIGSNDERPHPKALTPGHRVGGSFEAKEEDGPRPFVWQAGRFVRMSLPAGERPAGEVLGLNDRGDAVGWASWEICESEYSRRGVHCVALWRDGRFHDLSRLVPKTPSYDLMRALAVNAKGQILVEAAPVARPFPRTLLLLTPRP